MEYIGQLDDIFTSYMRIHYGPQYDPVPDTAAELERFIAQQRITQQEAAKMRSLFERRKADADRLTMRVSAAVIGLIVILGIWRLSV